MRNKEVARLLNEIADLLEIKGESIFRVGAYREAARRIDNEPAAIETLSAERKLREIKGVGESTAAKIEEYLSTGQLQYLTELKTAIPEGLVDLLRVPGLGPKKAKLVFERLGITSVPDLVQAARQQRLRDLPGMGAVSEEKLLRELDRWQNRGRRFLLGEVLPLAEHVAGVLRAEGHATQVEPCGSVRRRKGTIGDVDILAASEHPSETIACFTSLPIVKELIAKGPTKSTILTHDDFQMDLRVVPPASFGAALQYFTGSKEHNIRLRELAQKRGLKINEYGVFAEDTGERLGGEREADIYAALGLSCMPPELREDGGEIEAALAGNLPALLELHAIRGDLHVHSDWSDGDASLEDMARAAAAKGYQYMAISDHYKSLGIARGLSVERVHEQQAIIKQLNAKLRPFRILSSIEMDIRNDGTLDYEDEVLVQFDLVSAAIHSGMSQPRERITSRIVAAMRNPHVHIVTHPTGRIINQREAYEVDLAAVIDVAAETGTALEINASPNRLDLSDRDTRHAIERGVTIVINTDAHAVSHLDFMRYGVATARRGWATEKDILNTLSLAELLARLAARRP